MRGAQAHAELHPDVVAEAKRLRRASPKNVRPWFCTKPQISRIKHQGQSTVAALARGLHALKQVDASHTGTRLQTTREVMKEHEVSIICAVLSILASFWMILGSAEREKISATAFSGWQSLQRQCCPPFGTMTKR